MTTTTIKSEDARRNWRDLLDDAYAGHEMVIERYTKPVAVVVNYDEWRALKQAHVDELHRRSVEMDAGHFVTQEELEAGLEERGLH